MNAPSVAASISPSCTSGPRKPSCASKGLYDAVKSGVADPDDPALKDRITGLKSVRDQAQAEVERTAAALENNGHQAITPGMVWKFAATARERIRLVGGGYRRAHLRALAQRVEVADREVRIIGSKSNPLHALAAASGARPATFAVRSSVPKWRAMCDETGHWEAVLELG